MLTQVPSCAVSLQHMHSPMLTIYSSSKHIDATKGLNLFPFCAFRELPCSRSRVTCRGTCSHSTPSLASFGSSPQSDIPREQRGVVVWHIACLIPKTRLPVPHEGWGECAFGPPALPVHLSSRQERRVLSPQRRGGLHAAHREMPCCCPSPAKNITFAISSQPLPL